MGGWVSFRAISPGGGAGGLSGGESRGKGLPLELLNVRVGGRIGCPGTGSLCLSDSVDQTQGPRIGSARALSHAEDAKLTLIVATSYPTKRIGSVALVREHSRSSLGGLRCDGGRSPEAWTHELARTTPIMPHALAVPWAGSTSFSGG